MIESTLSLWPITSPDDRVTLNAVARAYSRCVELEDLYHAESADLSEEISNLRADLYALLMNALRQANIPFADRADAARIAYQLAT